MHCIENEYEQCLASIKQQTYKDFEYFIVRNLPNKEAHDKLYGTFMDNADQFDLFIKIDADMVLCRSTFFEEVVQRNLSSSEEIDDLEIAVYDHFTDRLIYGLHIYSHRMQWNLYSSEKIFVDKVGMARNYAVDFHDLAPAAYHCPDPSLFQSFHFGLHKAVKFLQMDAAKISYNSAGSHWVNIYLIYKRYLLLKSSSHLYALAGAITALKNNFEAKHVDFNNKLVLSHYEAFNSKSSFGKKIYVQINLIKRFFFLPAFISFEFNLFLSKNGAVPGIIDLLRNIKNVRGKDTIEKKMNVGKSGKYGRENKFYFKREKQ